MNKDFLKIAVKNIKVRPLRTWLTILGIVIGIFLVVSLLSLSEGLKNSVMRELNMMGGNLIIIVPGEDIMSSMIGGSELDDADIAAIERARGVETVVVMPWGIEVARYQNEAKTALITGIPFDRAIDVLRDDMGWQTTMGEFPRPGRREILIGGLVPRQVLPGVGPGDEISIKGKRFYVSGVLRSLGNSQDDSMIIMDLDDFRSVTGKREGTPMAMAKVSDGHEIQNVIQNIEDSLYETRKRKAGDDSMPFSVLSSDTVSDMVEGIMALLQAAVVAFASISIVVGGIGIMNTMFTSVKERTKEIGIMKAVGAKNSDITKIFLFESGIIGLIGGIGGVLTGIGLSKAAEWILSRGDQLFVLEAHISLSLILFGIGFSFLIGCLSGYLPARQASKLEPVEALRQE